MNLVFIRVNPSIIIVMAIMILLVDKAECSESLYKEQKNAIVSNMADSFIYSTINKKTGDKITLKVYNDAQNRLNSVCIGEKCINIYNKFPEIFNFGNISLNEIRISSIYQVKDYVQLGLEITSRNHKVHNDECPNITNGGIADIKISISISNKFGIYYLYVSCNGLSVISYSNFLLIKK